MNREYEICEYQSFMTDSQELNDLINKYLVINCLRVANNASFKTDYQDVEEHLFADPKFYKVFIVERNSNQKLPIIKGFLVADYLKGYNQNNILHCHGIILDPCIQGLGLGKKLVNYLIEKTNPDVVTAKTHNPRCFNMFANINGIKEFYPNGDRIPDDIYRIVYTNPFIEDVDNDLVYRNAYPDEKIQQEYRDNLIGNIFSKINLHDAQAIVSVINDEKLNLEKGKTYIKKR